MYSVTAQPPFIPLYRRLADEYRNGIITRQLHPGQRVDSINEIQKKHQVSRETAKLILKMLAREGYIIQRPGKGSFVANLAPLKKLWGVILPFFSIQYQELVNDLSEHARALGRQLHSFTYHNNWQEEIRLVGELINKRYESMIIIPTLDESKTASFYSRLSSKETHVALIDHTMAGSSFSFVIQSYDLGVQRAARYLIEKASGAKVAFVRSGVTAGRNLVEELMEETFKDVLRAASGEETSFVSDRAAEVTPEFMIGNGIRGIFCGDDTDAIRIIGRLKAQGIEVGREYALVSYGNTELAQYFTPAITSVDPHNGEMAAMVARILKQKIDDENTEFCQYVVQPELIVRGT